MMPTQTGRPYFVMELVNGIPLTDYFDEQRLTPKERLELFVPVCQAIQHAHQKGIIHRDLKPGNILVAEYDHKPVPKVIDFGVAKATSQTLTEKTMFTQLGQIVGTLDYMSPEQAKRNQLDVDTRSDIYSLGVILYELLTGETPFDKQRLRSAAFDELLRIIREEEPPRPSVKLSTCETLPSIAANRHIEPHKLSTLIRGELDWIVMKALEKDRGRRYETASAFAADVQHYLNDEAVVACPPSAVYRLKKLVRRNRARLTIAAVCLAAVIVAIGSLGWTIRDRTARQQESVREQLARQERVAGQVDVILDEVHRLIGEQNWSDALAAAQHADTLVAGADTDAETQERVQRILDDLKFIQRLEEIRLLKGTWTDTSFNLSGVDSAYSAAFWEHGTDVEDVSEERAGSILHEHPTLAVPLAVALDEWADARRYLAGPGDSSWVPLVALANQMDPDPQRQRLRSLWGRPITDETKNELTALAHDERLGDQPPTTLVLLARA